MKICILTQPLHTNYGGLLQAYALQRVLSEMGHEVWTEDRQPNSFSRLRRLVRSDLVRGLVGQPRYLTRDERSIIRQHTDRFIEQNIRTTVPIDSINKEALKPYGFEGYVVGSDQVWRKGYSEGIENYFLDFASEQSRKVAYAASFGVSEWEYTPSQTRRLAQLVQRFDLVTVRENDGVTLCRTHLGTTATRVLDPTLLLDVEHYLGLVSADPNLRVKRGGVVSYLLDASAQKQQMAQRVASHMSLEINDISPCTAGNTIEVRPIEDRVAMPVEQWLSSMLSADFVVTDSFHGVAFAILFNRQFVAIPNSERGASRITSLLELFGLASRQLSHPQALDDILTSKIEFGAINSELKRQRDSSLELLRSAL